MSPIVQVPAAASKLKVAPSAGGTFCDGQKVGGVAGSADEWRFAANPAAHHRDPCWPPLAGLALTSFFLVAVIQPQNSLTTCQLLHPISSVTGPGGHHHDQQTFASRQLHAAESRSPIIPPALAMTSTHASASSR